jgi:mannosyltransferase
MTASTQLEARKDRTTGWMLGAIAVLAALLIAPWLNKPMYRDEGASLYSAHLSWSALMQQSRVVDLVLLPYYVLMHFWLLASASIWWARALSLLAFSLTVFLVGWIGNRLGGRWCALVASVVLATNPLMIAAALNARPYGLTTLSATVSIVCLVQWLWGGAVRWIWWFSFFALLTALLQVFGGCWRRSRRWP